MIQYSSLDDAWGSTYKDISKNNDSNKINIAQEFNIATEKYNNQNKPSNQKSFEITPNIDENSNFKESNIYSLSQPDTFIFENKALEKTKTTSSKIPAIKKNELYDQQSSINVFSDFLPNRNEMIKSNIDKFTTECNTMDHISQCKYCQRKLMNIIKNYDSIKININDKQYQINRNILKIIFVFIIIIIIILMVSMIKNNVQTTKIKYNYLPNYNPYLAHI